MRAEWRSVWRVSGGQYVVMSGTDWMLKWCANSLVCPLSVSLFIDSDNTSTLHQILINHLNCYQIPLQIHINYCL